MTNIHLLPTTNPRYRDSRDQVYEKHPDGSIRKVWPLKLWGSKVERRLVIRARRARA